ncbi:MAG: alpha-D-ribose 1-methylphosphonate 5-triphosphate diphosphatase [Rhodospirillales bacterium]|nr:alpha-D-ribose 1-methylphosphonate 5-triphosphate diphosphatase [Rhodospirillales bacterium]
MSADLVFTNARLVLPDEILSGWMAVSDGIIQEFGRGTTRSGMDLGGDLLIPGLVELHTDHLETHLRPRPMVRWPEASAIMAFDAQIAASGITTVFDCVRTGHDLDLVTAYQEVETVVAALADAEKRCLLRVDHRLHVRCEICADDVVSTTGRLMDRYRVDLISLMDHTPGARQFTSLDAWRTYYGGKSGRPESELDRLVQLKRKQFAKNYLNNRRGIVELAAAGRTVLASHDDATPAHVDESIGDSVAIAEFPTTVEAARLSHAAGIKVMMGAPNVVRGGSHSGNVAAEELARAGVLDILSSDYVPASLLFGAFDLARRVEGLDLAQALRCITATPARAAGLNDRGEIAIGKRGDLVRVAVSEGLPVVREVYRGGRRIL